MANDGQRLGKGRDASGTYAEDVRGKQREEQLRRSFAKFRSGHRAGTRIPQALREAALAALASGMREGRVRGACGISRTQLRWWRQSQGACGQVVEHPEPKARVFPVVDEPANLAAESAEGPSSQSLQLRFGRWDISIRQVEL